jgi:hypothetical protein
MLDHATALVDWRIALELPGAGVHILWQRHPGFHEAIDAALHFAGRVEGRVLSVERNEEEHRI